MVGVCGLVLYFVLCLFLADAQLSLSLTYQNLVHVFFTSALPLSPHATNESTQKRIGKPEGVSRCTDEQTAKRARGRST